MLFPLSNKLWIGTPPPLVLWRKFLWQSGFRPGRRTRLALLDYPTLVKIQAESAYFAGQQIRPNDVEQRKLLRHSFLHLLPHEVWQVRLRTKIKSGLAGNVHHGGVVRAAGMVQVLSEISLLGSMARRRGLDICEIEVAHTHPSLELLIIEPHRPRFVFNGLSSADIRLGRALAPFLDVPLRLRAITRAANYAMVFSPSLR